MGRREAGWRRRRCRLAAAGWQRLCGPEMGSDGPGWPGVPLLPRPAGHRDGAGSTGIPHDSGGGASLRLSSDAAPPVSWRPSLYPLGLVMRSQ